MLFSFSFFGWLNKKPATAWAIAGFEKLFESNQDFVTTTPKGREQRCQMTMWPLTGACVFISLVNVAFI